MSIDRNTIQQVARLSAIELTEEEEVGLQADLGQVLDYVSQLSKVNTEGVEPTSHVHGAVNALREDVVRDSLSLESVEKNAPEFVSGGFRVPKVIG